MTMLSLIKGRSALLATDQCVFAPDEVGALQSLIEQSVKLEQLYRDAQQQLEQERADASIRGFDEGLHKGYAASAERAREEAQQQLASSLLLAETNLHQERTALRDDASQLAADIVRKIGLIVPAGQSLAMLAVRAAEELRPDEQATLQVSVAQYDDVRQRLQHFSNSPGCQIVDVMADESLADGQCVLQTRFGTAHCGLEAQLAVIERELQDSGLSHD